MFYIISNLTKNKIKLLFMRYDFFSVLFLDIMLQTIRIIKRLDMKSSIF